MKLRMALFLLLLISQNAFSKSLGNVFQSIASTANLNKGISMTANNFGTLQTSRQIAKSLYRDWNVDAYQGGCRFKVTSGKKHALNLILSKVNDKETYRALASRKTSHNLKNVISIEWDKKSGKKSFCDLNSVYVYGTKGEFLYLEYKN